MWLRCETDGVSAAPEAIAEAREVIAAEGAGEDIRQVEDAHAVER